MPVHTILIAEDDPVQRRTLRRMMEGEIDAEIIEAEDGSEALQHLRGGTPVSLALLDLQMPVVDGMSVLRQSRTLFPRLPCIVLTASERIEDAVEAMQLGAIDFITKPAQRERLITSVRNALALSNLQEEVSRLQQGRGTVYSFADITGVSQGLSEVAALGRKAAGSDISILITGESGVGKEIVAQALHRESRRDEKNFVTVNCGALPDNLVESTLFGHEKGAFTGAVTRSIGKCREADGGTLFLDEVGELKPDTQVKLLRLLQQGEIEPVGSSKTIKVDVRVISATNQPLADLVAQGKFREDLYYRLQGMPLHIPPLRERKQDIPKLAAHLLERILLSEGRTRMTLTQGALDCLSSYPWPGNVRELYHILHRAVLLAETDKIEAVDLSRWFKSAAVKNIAAHGAKSDAAASDSIALMGADGQPKSLEQIEQEVIDATLARHEFHIGKAAAALGIGQSTLYKRMQKDTDLQKNG